MKKNIQKRLSNLLRLQETYLEIMARTEDPVFKQYFDMVFEADTYRVQADIYHAINPAATYEIVSNLELGFTFEDFLAEAERVLDKGKKK